ncbi:MAG: sigma-70 family RNA polymerase sigma factor [Bacteroidales bacterium]|nr:sigma-70 family RNA polymerase sigma factor [Bacteroidales bacterium]
MRQLVITRSITRRDSTSFEKYLQDIAKVEMISPDEEIILAKKIKKGDHKALEKLVKANLRFVVSVAKQYQNRGLNLQDLINEGNLGLIKAARLFDETRGFKFISYAVWWIRQSILSAIAEQSRIVRLPVNKVGALRQISKVTMKFQQENDRLPTSEELAKLMDISLHKLETYLKSNSRQVSIDAPAIEDKDRKMIDFMEDKEVMEPDEPLMSQSLKQEIMRILGTLPAREKEVVALYFGLSGTPKTLIEIGQLLDISRERARQIKDRAIRDLRKPSKQKLLKKYLAQ